MCLHVTIPPNLTSFLLFLEIKDLQHPSALLSGIVAKSVFASGSLFFEAEFS